MRKRFLVSTATVFDNGGQFMAVFAESAEEAIQKYRREVQSKDEGFRTHVLDLAVNVSFLEQFFLATPEEQDHFNNTGDVTADYETVKGRVRAFFSDRPDLGERYVQYMDTQNVELIDDEMFAFISEREIDWERYVAFDPESVPELA